MSKTLKRAATGRRRFLRDMAIAGGAAAVALKTKVNAADVPAEATDAGGTAESKGYHLTPHIREYYDKARS